MEPSLCVVLHDVAPDTWGACQRVIDAVGEVAPVPLTLLAVPRYHGAARSPAFEATLTQRHECGDELALHGYTHQDDGTPAGPIDRLRRQWYTAGEGEFADLSREAATQRLVAGLRWFQANRWPLYGFVAPAWLLSPGTWEALAVMPLTYTSTLRKIYTLPQRQSITSPSVVYSTRAGWRRLASVCWNSALYQAGQDSQLLVRFELHPHDADHFWVRRSWQRLLSWHLQYRRAMTVAEFVRQWQESACANTLPATYWHPGEETAALPLVPSALAAQNNLSTPAAIKAPMTAPASTSLG
ncbi:polysaccharide deacetylase family protein [Eleftheria terrae]|uniref:polysaccharide deacetylase family protein n=1 Tax=Eleftheria terrae TaxID=1597781 RepID=UPI00263B60F0|nr:polysaccharide deacetylase family protein [Eleftheria terrae]WKB54292.1 polysaccharide deacetylase family protein [Eleftheria terrae]